MGVIKRILVVGGLVVGALVLSSGQALAYWILI